LLTLRQIDLRRGGQPLLQGANLTLHNGWHVGIIGANGSGKSSLFQLLLGQLTPDHGDLELPGGVRIAHMAQEISAADASAVDYVLGGHLELMRVHSELAQAEAEGDYGWTARLHAELDAIEGYTVRARAEQLMTGLGFSPDATERPVSDFSGGWRMRLNLARALIRPSDILLLDEPTNHLDLDAVLWLEQWLMQYSGTLLLISHDRDFLDNVVGHIVHVDQGQLIYYRGHYSAFEHQRAERLARQQAAYKRQQQRVAEIERFVARFRAKASKARQAQSRLKELERMEQIAPAHVDSPFRFELPEAEKTSNPLLVLRDAAMGYADAPVLNQVTQTLLPEQRIGLLGPNGAGKSTLIKTLVGELPLLDGERIPGEHLSVGYFAQHQLDALDVDASPFEHLRRESPQASDQRLRDFLGGFGFSGDDALEPVRLRSGGEKARLALALVAWRRPNLLLLDEPTNHLDLEMRHALDLALQGFSGAVLLVTHDRHLLRDTVDEFWLVHSGRVEPFEGDLEDYRAWLRDHRQRHATPAREAPTSGRDRKGERREAARRREALQPLRQELARLEDALAARQDELQGLESELAEPDLYTPSRKAELQRLMQRQGELRQAIDRLEAQWLEVGERLETAEAELGSS